MASPPRKLRVDMGVNGVVARASALGLRETRPRGCKSSQRFTTARRHSFAVARQQRQRGAQHPRARASGSGTAAREPSGGSSSSSLPARSAAPPAAAGGKSVNALSSRPLGALSQPQSQHGAVANARVLVMRVLRAAITCGAGLSPERGPSASLATFSIPPAPPPALIASLRRGTVLTDGLSSSRASV